MSNTAPEMRTAYDAVRHFLRSLAFRFHHVTEDAPAGFGEFDAGSGVRNPARIVRHLSVMLLFVHDQFEPGVMAELEPLDWEGERARFFAALAAFDAVLAAGRPVRSEVRFEQLWQGQLIDAMTHVGQLATLRRLAGAPVPAVRYWQVEMPPVESYL